MSELDRRTAIKWVMAASAALKLPSVSFDALAAAPATQGYGKDPDLMKVYASGDLWPLTLNKEQRATATALSDLIIPADDTSPAASSVGVVDFIDEWISAPYPDHAVDRKTVLDGLGLTGENFKREALQQASQQKSHYDLALYQLGYFSEVWEPFFGNGSAEVLHSALSRVLPIPDAALGVCRVCLPTRRLRGEALVVVDVAV